MKNKKRQIVSREVYSSHTSAGNVTAEVRNEIIADYLSQQKPTTKLYLVEYTEKSVALFGDTKPFKNQWINLKGSFCWGLEAGGKGSNTEKQPGWIFSLLRIDQLKAAVEAINATL